jgi:hypothetical protein
VCVGTYVCVFSVFVLVVLFCLLGMYMETQGASLFLSVVALSPVALPLSDLASI